MSQGKHGVGDLDEEGSGEREGDERSQRSQ